MKKNDQDIKIFSVRMPSDLWKFLKITSINQKETMNDLIVRCIAKYKKKFENKLTDKDTLV